MRVVFLFCIFLYRNKKNMTDYLFWYDKWASGVFVVVLGDEDSYALIERATGVRALRVGSVNGWIAVFDGNKHVTSFPPSSTTESYKTYTVQFEVDEMIDEGRRVLTGQDLAALAEI